MALSAFWGYSYKLKPAFGIRQRGLFGIKNPGVVPRYPIMNSGGKFVVTPMVPGLRFAGLVEFCGLTATPNYRLSKRLLAHAKTMFPTINTSDFTEWMGHRPALPDSLPVIGRSSKCEQVSTRLVTIILA